VSAAAIADATSRIAATTAGRTNLIRGLDH
jgi:hypothetical protein